MKEGTRFLQGALVLSMAGIIVKILGAVYRVPLYNILGPEGMGLFQAAYPVYAMMMTISVAGIPVAVSKLVADRIAVNNYAGAKQVFKVSLLFMVATSVLATLLLIGGAKYYAENILRAPDVYWSLIAIAPALLFFGIMSTFRGFFQGQQKMGPTAWSQITEQAIRVITILVLATILVKHGTNWGAAGAAFGTVTGVVISLGFLFVLYLRQRNHFNSLAQSGAVHLQPTRKLIKELIWLALPISITSIIIPLSNTVDSVITIPRLQSAGFELATAVEMFGNLAGATIPLVSLPSVITIALAASTIPAIANALSGNKPTLVVNLSNASIKIGLLMGIPAAIGLFLLAEPISLMLFNNLDVVYTLRPAAVIIIFISLLNSSNAILYGLGKPHLPVRNTLIGLGLKFIVTFILTGIQEINILGPVVGTTVYFLVASSLNLQAISLATNGQLKLWRNISRISLNGFAMGIIIYLTQKIPSLFFTAAFPGRLAATINVLWGLLIGITFYGVIAVLSGTVSRNELRLIPNVGEKLTTVLVKIKLLKN